MRLRRKIGLRKIAQKAERHKFIYKVVDEKKISAGINHIHGRNVYAGRSMWSCNGDIQKCVVCYEVTKMQMGTEELKLDQSEKSLLSL